MRKPVEILDEIYISLEEANLIYELKSLKNEVSNHFNFTEFVAETGSILLSMNNKKEVNKSIGNLIKEYISVAHSSGIFPESAKFYSLEQKIFVVDGKDFEDLKGFYNAIGKQLVENNNWGKNWNAFNDILRGGFIKTEFGDPIILKWKNSEISKQKLTDFKDIVTLIKEHKHIDLILE